MSFWSNWFKSDEEKCRELIGRPFIYFSDNPFEDNQTIEVTEVKCGYLKFKIDGIEINDSCDLFMLVYSKSNISFIEGGIKDPNVFVKGEDADDWDTKTSYSASERPRDVFKKY